MTKALIGRVKMLAGAACVVCTVGSIAEYQSGGLDGFFILGCISLLVWIAANEDGRSA